MLAAVLAVLAVVAGFAVAPWLALPLGAFAALFAWSGRQSMTLGPSVQLNNLAYERLTRGHVDEAESLLDKIPERAKRTYVSRFIEMQRSMIALYRGDAEGAVVHATLAIDGATRLLTRDFEDRQIAAARSFRALACASLGRDDEATGDADAAESSDAAGPAVHARVALTRAMLLARTDTSALADHVAKTGGRVLDWLTPRERTLFRALRQMARARPKSVYREAARPDETTEEGRVVAWVAKLAPGAAGFVMAERYAAVAEAHEAPAPAANVMRDLERARDARKGRDPMGASRPQLAILAVLLVGFVGIGQLVLPRAAPVRTARPAQQTELTVEPFVPLLGGGLLIGVALFATLVRRNRRGSRRILRAEVAIARGDETLAAVELASTAASQLDALAATAELSLARLAERRAQWDTTIRHCDTGMARATRKGAVRASLSDLLIPELVEIRALALAALDRPAESDAELALLGRDHPTYAFAARATFRAGLVAAARASDLTAAVRLARTRTLDLPLSLRDEMLADVVLAVAEGASEDEVGRLEADLRDDAQLRGWLESVAPGLRERLGARSARVATPAAAQTDLTSEDEGPTETAVPAKYSD